MIDWLIDYHNVNRLACPITGLWSLGRNILRSIRKHEPQKKKHQNREYHTSKKTVNTTLALKLQYSSTTAASMNSTGDVSAMPMTLRTDVDLSVTWCSKYVCVLLPSISPLTLPPQNERGLNDAHEAPRRSAPGVCLDE